MQSAVLGTTLRTDDGIVLLGTRRFQKRRAHQRPRRGQGARPRCVGTQVAQRRRADVLRGAVGAAGHRRGLGSSLDLEQLECAVRTAPCPPEGLR
jgi:hypothetical protein